MFYKTVVISYLNLVNIMNIPLLLLFEEKCYLIAQIPHLILANQFEHV
jgi:hypothetical protein